MSLPRRCSEREPAVSLRDESNVIGGWLPPLTLSFAEKMWPFKTKVDDEPTVLIHGDAWKIKDVTDEVVWCLSQEWHRKTWKPTPALIHKKGGRVSQYCGQKYDPAKIELVEDGWNHDHCSICCWKLRESEDDVIGIGYRNDANSWICSECFEQFIRDDKLKLKTNSEQAGGHQPPTRPEST